MKLDPSRCPECGEPALGSLDTVLARLYYVPGDDSYEWSGETDLDTQSGQYDPEGRQLVCCTNGHTYHAQVVEDD